MFIIFNKHFNHLEMTDIFLLKKSLRMLYQKPKFKSQPSLNSRKLHYPSNQQKFTHELQYIHVINSIDISIAN